MTGTWDAGGLFQSHSNAHSYSTAIQLGMFIRSQTKVFLQTELFGSFISGGGQLHAWSSRSAVPRNGTNGR